MREIKTHVVENDSINSQLVLEATDEPDKSGANHKYQIKHLRDRLNTVIYGVIGFQQGPIGETGVNGLTNEVLMAIVADRLEGFQRGPFACNENQYALENVRNAMTWLRRRTEKRIARGVEGTYAV